MSEVKTRVLGLIEASKKKDDTLSVSNSLTKAAASVLHSHDIVADGELSDGDISLYVLNRETNEIASISDLQVEFLINRAYPGLKIKDRKEVLRYLKFDALAERPIDMKRVQPVAFADEPDVMTWNRLSVNKSALNTVELDELPGFAHILNLCDDPDSLALWIGSLLDPHSARVQYLHWHGGGGNGKSTLFQGLAKVLGEKHVVYTRADDFLGTHWGQQVEGARLLLFTEENSGTLFSSGKFKEFTGEDYTTINPKYKQARRVTLTHKTAVLSNTKVAISNNAADRRRLLSISSEADPDPNIGYRWWHDELKNQGEKILVFCYSEYLKAVALDPTYRAFIPPSEAAVTAAIERKYAEITDVITDLYTITGNEADVVKRSALHKAVSDELKERRSSRHFVQQLGEALTQLGVTQGKIHGNVSVYRGLKSGTNSNVAQDAKNKGIP